MAEADHVASGPKEAELSLRADAPAPLRHDARTNKKIIVFSDGTGNSSGKLLKTNVFRLYEALDLGPGEHGAPTQIAYYDNGVGTSSIKFLAIIGGVFGFGLRRNVLELYRFVCRNYDDGEAGKSPPDEIHAFGFSRGAFTIRLLVALICDRGIVAYEDERELQYYTADAFYTFIDENAPDVFPAFWLICRGLRQAFRFIKRQLLNVTSRKGDRLAWNPVPKYQPDVEFVGVWDTVAAYGGPISEITRGIDKYVWPLTMTDYELPAKVKAARHALALDDERDSFWPLPWNEVAEERRSLMARTDEDREKFRDRLKQVWFAGMHADVGGGYADDSLAYVPLSWMIGEIGGRLNFLKTEVERIKAFANPFGPIHDSRKGLGSYYRYQPRKIAALLHRSVDPKGFNQTRVLRDPTIGEKRYRPEGLLLRCHVHESVITRIGEGNDNYAPIVLPRDFEVVGPNIAKITETIDNLNEPSVREARVDAQESAWDDVWKRRAGYGAILAMTAILVISPLMSKSFNGNDPFRPKTDARWVVDIVIGWFEGLVPSFAMPWFRAFQHFSIMFSVFGAVIALISARMAAQDMRLSDNVRRGWWDAIAGRMTATPSSSTLRKLRNSFPYQRGLQIWKWGILPFVVGVMILGAIVYGASIVVSQYLLTRTERAAELCLRGSAGPFVRQAVAEFDASDPCSAIGVTLVAGRRYRIVFIPRTPLTDGGYAVKWGGQSSFAFSGSAKIMMLLAAPYRRVVPANWLEPLVELRSTGSARPMISIQQFESPQIFTLSAASPASLPLAITGEFTAERSGSLHVFLNDVILPVITPDYFYRGDKRTRNSGMASICVEDITIRPDPNAYACPHPRPGSQ